MIALLRCSAFLFITAFVSLTLADDTLSADEISKRIVRGTGFTWDGAQTRLKMILTEKGGAKKERILDVLGRKVDGKVQSVVRFLAPRDVAGTAFLMKEKAGGGAEQHIYLPGLRRTRRIVGREQEGSFMGSDFTYADLRGGGFESAQNRRLPDEKLGDASTYVVESTLKPGAKSQYGKVQTWVRKTDYVPLRTRFYDNNGKLLKTLYARRVKEYEGRPVVVEARMQSEDGHATVLLIESIKRRNDLTDSQFTPTALER